MVSYHYHIIGKHVTVIPLYNRRLQYQRSLTELSQMGDVLQLLFFLGESFLLNHREFMKYTKLKAKYLNVLTICTVGTK